MNGCGNGAFLFVRAPEGERKVSQTCYFFCPGRTGFMAHWLLQTSKELSDLQTALGQKRGLRLGCMGLE
jgi:hypothetical protein